MRIVGFKLDYPNLNLTASKNDSSCYYIAIFHAILKQAKKGYRFTKIHKATKKGTSIAFVEIKESEIESYRKVLYKMVADLNEKFNAGLVLTETKDIEDA